MPESSGLCVTIAKLCLTDFALTVSPVPHLFNVEFSECNRGDTCAQASSSERNSGMTLNNWRMLFREHMFRFSLSFFRSRAENPLVFSSILRAREKIMLIKMNYCTSTNIDVLLMLDIFAQCSKKKMKWKKGRVNKCNSNEGT